MIFTHGTHDYTFSKIQIHHCDKCVLLRSFRTIFLRVHNDRRPWTALSCTMRSLIISLRLRAAHVTDNTSRLDMTLQGPGSRLQDWDWLPQIPSSPTTHSTTSTTTFPVDTHEIPKRPYQGGKLNIHSSHTCKKGLFLQLAHTVWPVRETFAAAVVAVVQSCWGTHQRPQHSNVRHPPSLSGRCCRQRYWFFFFVSVSCLVSFISTKHHSACCVPFSKRHLLSASAHECEAVPRRRWLLSRRLPHFSPLLQIGDTILCRWKDLLALATGSYLQPVKNPHLNSVCWSVLPPHSTLFPLVCTLHKFIPSFNCTQSDVIILRAVLCWI